jgi:hypothetical protein
MVMSRGSMSKQITKSVSSGNKKRKTRKRKTKNIQRKPC